MGGASEGARSFRGLSVRGREEATPDGRRNPRWGPRLVALNARAWASADTALLSCPTAMLPRHAHVAPTATRIRRGQLETHR